MLLDIINLTPLQLGISIIVIFTAYTVKGLSGFGSGLIAIPLLAMIFPLTLIVPVMALLSYSGTLMQSYQYHQHVKWIDLIPLIPFSIIGISIAIWLLVNIESSLLIRVLGVFVILYSIYSLLSVSITRGSRRWAAAAGMGGGIFGALFGTGGPFYVLYLKMRQLNKSEFRATIAMVFLFDGGVRVAGYAYSGLYTQQLLILLLTLLPVLILGMYVGSHLHIKINQQRFNQVISVLLMCSGAMLIYKSYL